MLEELSGWSDGDGLVREGPGQILQSPGAILQNLEFIPHPREGF